MNELRESIGKTAKSVGALLGWLLLFLIFFTNPLAFIGLAVVLGLLCVPFMMIMDDAKNLRERRERERRQNSKSIVPDTLPDDWTKER